MVESGHGRWRGIFPRCADRCCSRTRTLWRRFLGREGIYLQHAWYCSPQCLEIAARQLFARASVNLAPSTVMPHRVPLGLLLLSRGQLTNSQLRSALAAQRAQGSGAIGYWVEKLGFASEHQVTAALGLQWACPVLPPFAADDSNCSHLVPLRLLQRFRMLPVHFSPSTRALYVAFSERIDYTALHTIGQMLDCRAEACLLNRSAMERVLEQLAEVHRPSDFLFDGGRQVEEMARVTCGYALKLGAKEARILTCGEYVWARLVTAADATHLLFPRPTFPFAEGSFREMLPNPALGTAPHP